MRGFHFEAPLSMILTGFQVPDDETSSSPFQTVYVFVENAATPIYPASVSLTPVFKAVDEPSGSVLSASVPVAAGQFVTVLGAKSSSEGGNFRNMYASSNAFTSTIDGIDVILTRALTQNADRGLSAYDVSLEQGNVLSRVLVYYNTQPCYIASGKPGCCHEPCEDLVTALNASCADNWNQDCADIACSAVGNNYTADGSRVCDYQACEGTCLQSAGDCPTNAPTTVPSADPTRFPTLEPSRNPSTIPSLVPSGSPSSQPSMFPTISDCTGSAAVPCKHKYAEDGSISEMYFAVCTQHEDDHYHQECYPESKLVDVTPGQYVKDGRLLVSCGCCPDEGNLPEGIVEVKGKTDICSGALDCETEGYEPVKVSKSGKKADFEICVTNKKGSSNVEIEENFYIPDQGETAYCGPCEA